MKSLVSIVRNKAFFTYEAPRAAILASSL